jgi:hypothetical protein
LLVASTLGDAYRLCLGPPFPPVAQRWIFTWLLSSATCPGVSGLPATAANIACQINAAQNPPIIPSLGTGLVGRQMRFDFRPLLIAKPKQARIHGWPPNRLTNQLNQHLVNEVITL